MRVRYYIAILGALLLAARWPVTSRGKRTPQAGCSPVAFYISDGGSHVPLTAQQFVHRITEIVELPEAVR